MEANEVRVASEKAPCAPREGERQRGNVRVVVGEGREHRHERLAAERSAHGIFAHKNDGPLREEYVEDFKHLLVAEDAQKRPQPRL